MEVKVKRSANNYLSVRFNFHFSNIVSVVGRHVAILLQNLFYTPQTLNEKKRRCRKMSWGGWGVGMAGRLRGGGHIYEQSNIIGGMYIKSKFNI